MIIFKSNKSVEIVIIFHVIVLENVLANLRAVYPGDEIFHRSGDEKGWIFYNFSPDANMTMLDELRCVLDVLRHFISDHHDR